MCNGDTVGDENLQTPLNTMLLQYFSPVTRFLWSLTFCDMLSTAVTHSEFNKFLLNANCVKVYLFQYLF